ncbi:MAG: hypothetical protein NTW25_10550 [Candidatus Kapabacteria bacterium]|nr:hypothetical protein [Candidatus Kapabacteria bacterium]
MKINKIVLAFLVLNVSIFVALSQPTFVTSIDTNNVLIGDKVKFTLVATYDKSESIIFPQILDSVGKLEIVSRFKPDTIDLKNGKFKIINKFEITSFDSGNYEVPAYILLYDKKGFDTPFPVSSNSHLLHFNTLQVDKDKEIKDIKNPLDVPFNILDYIWYFVAVALLILAVYIFLYYRLKKKEIKEEPRYDPKIPPHISALEALKLLDNKKLWQSGQIKNYYSELTDILRLYIERTFVINAFEMISEEIYIALVKMKIESESTTDLNKIMQLSDLAKFAKASPEPFENSLCMDLAIKFVNNNIKYYKAPEEEESK